MTSTNGRSVRICCLVCGQLLEQTTGRHSCPTCDRPYNIDEFGIVQLAQQDFYYREMPRTDLQAVLQTSVDGAELLVRFDRIARGQGTNFSSYIRSYAFDSRRAAGVFLLDLNEQSVVLDFGSGWGTITRVLAGLCSQVVSMDLTYESLQFSARISHNKNVQYVHGGESLRLPFQDGQFSAVILNGVLEWLPEGNNLNQSPGGIQQEFLKEVYRVLQPNGQVYIGIENRFGYKYFTGVKEDHTGLRFGALLPRWIANQYSHAVRKRPYRTYTYSYRGYRELLRESGFSVDIYHPYPDYRRFDRLLLPHNVNSDQESNYRPRSKKGRTLDAGISAAKKLALFQWLTPSYSVLGERAGPAASSSVVEQILLNHNEALIDVISIRCSLAQTILVETAAHFFKVAITEQAAQRLRSAGNAITSIQSAFPDLVPYTAVDFQTQRCNFATYSIQPRHRPSQLDESGLCSLLEAYFGHVANYVADAYLALADRFARVLNYVASTNADLASAFNDRVDQLEQRLWPLAPTHGDLHGDNLLTLDDNRSVINDWDRFEPCGPYQIDAIHAHVRNLMGDMHMSWPEAIEAMLEEQKGTNASGYRLFGVDIDRASISLYILDKLEKDISSVAHYAYLSEYWHIGAKQAMKLVVQLSF